MNTKAKIGAYEVGTVVGAVSARYESKATAPPDRYDMATILDLMLEAHKLADNDADRAVLKMVEGLGTARTRQAIVDGLVRKGFLTVTTRRKRHLLAPSALAEQLRDKIPPMLGSVAMTAKWEHAFALIEKGEIPWRAVVDKAFLFATEIVKTAKSHQGNFAAASAGGGKAPAGLVRK
jgi:DNA topoisomerase-3